MDKQAKKHLRIEIGNLLDNECGPCNLRACNECRVMEQLTNYRLLLEPEKKKEVVVVDDTPKEMKVYVRAQPKEYTKLFDKGLNNKEVAEKLNVSLRTVVKYRREYKSKKGEKGKVINKRIALSHEEYVKFFEKGMTTNEIAMIVGCAENTIYNHRRKWIERNYLNNV